jgi:hypothetical protein
MAENQDVLSLSSFKPCCDNKKDKAEPLSLLQTPPEVKERLEEEFDIQNKPDSLDNKAWWNRKTRAKNKYKTEHYAHAVKLHTPPEVRERLEDEFDIRKKPDSLDNKAWRNRKRRTKKNYKEEYRKNLLTMSSEQQSAITNTT